LELTSSAGHLDVNGISYIINDCYVFSGCSSSEMPVQEVFANDNQSKVSIWLSSYLMKVIIETRRTHYIRYLHFLNIYMVRVIVEIYLIE